VPPRPRMAPDPLVAASAPTIGDERRGW
jgi:hypothetical protein